MMILGISDYSVNDQKIENVIEVLKKQSEIYPAINKDLYFQANNFKNTEYLSYYDNFLILLSSICKRTNTCLKIHLGFELDSDLYYNVNVALIIDNQGNLVEEEFVDGVGEIESDFDSDDGGTIPLFYCDRVPDGFDIRDGWETVDNYIDITDNLEDFSDRIVALQSTLDSHYHPTSSRVFEKDLSIYFKSNRVFHST